MDQERQIAELDHRHLSHSPNSRDLPAHQCVERWVESLHHVHPRRQRRFHRRSSQRRVKSASGYLDLGKLGHAERLDLNLVHSTGSRHEVPGQRTSGKEGLMQELPTIQPISPDALSPAEIAALSEEVRALAAERNAVILAHNYQLPEVQDVADHMGDSLGLSRAAAATDAEAIVFCGVHFMAETASILSPEKTVLIPDLDAGCSLADSITADQLRAWKAQHPGAMVVM